MYCFNHDTNHASGICKCCQKALCKNCIEILYKYVSCKNSDCQKNIKYDLEIMDRSKKIYKIGEYNRPTLPLTAEIMIGAVSICYGVYDYLNSNRPLISFSAYLICFGLIVAGRGLHKIYGKDKLNI